MILQVGVKVLLKNPEGKYLLLKRNFEKYPEMDKTHAWDFPGGRIEIGRPLLDNLKREILEETGLTIISEPKLLIAQDILYLSEKHVVRLTYYADTSGEPSLSDEHETYNWFLLDEMLNLEHLDPISSEAISFYLTTLP